MPGKVAPEPPGGEGSWNWLWGHQSLDSSVNDYSGLQESRREGGPPSQLLNHWLHLSYVSSLGVPCFNVAALLWGTWGGGAGSRGLESQIDKQPVPWCPGDRLRAYRV